MEKLNLAAQPILPATTPRDVLKTLIHSYIEAQIAQQQHLSAAERKQLEDELCDDQALEQSVEELIEADEAQQEVPIQIGFGIGIPSTQQN